MRYDEIAAIIKLIEASHCDEFNIETPELKLSWRRTGTGAPSPVRAEPVAPLPAVAVILFAPSGEVPDQFAAVRRFIRRPDGPLERLQEQERVAAVHGARRPSDMAGAR